MDFTQIIITIITVIVGPSVILLTKFLIDYLMAKTADAKIKGVLADVGASIDTSFMVWNKVFDDAKIELSVDGVFDGSDLQAAIKKAAAAAEKTLTAETIAYLQKNSIDISQYLVGKITAKIGGTA